MRMRQGGREDPSRSVGEMRRGRRVVGEMRLRQRGVFKECWGDEEGAESSLQGRLEASKESSRDENAAETQRGVFKKCWGDEEGVESSVAYNGD